MTRHEFVARMTAAIEEVVDAGRSAHVVACVAVGEFESYVRGLAATAAVDALYRRDDDGGE